MTFTEMFARLHIFLRRLFNEPIDCPWCRTRLDKEFGIFKRYSPVDVTMAHAPECNNYLGDLRIPAEGVTWDLWVRTPIERVKTMETTAYNRYSAA